MASTLADINSQIKKHDEQIAQLRKQAEELRNQERAGVVEELRKKIAEYGLTAADLKLGARGGKRSTAWSGPRRLQSIAVLPAKPGRVAAGASRAGSRRPWLQASRCRTSRSSRRFAFHCKKKPAHAGFSIGRGRPQLTITSLPLTPREPMCA